MTDETGREKETTGTGIVKEGGGVSHGVEAGAEARNVRNAGMKEWQKRTRNGCTRL